MSEDRGVVFGEGAELARGGLERDLCALADRVKETEARMAEAQGVVRACREELVGLGAESRRLQHSLDALTGKARRGRKPKSAVAEEGLE